MQYLFICWVVYAALENVSASDRKPARSALFLTETVPFMWRPFQKECRCKVRSRLARLTALFPLGSLIRHTDRRSSRCHGHFHGYSPETSLGKFPHPQ